MLGPVRMQDLFLAATDAVSLGTNGSLAQRALDHRMAAGADLERSGPRRARGARSGRWRQPRPGAA